MTITAIERKNRYILRFSGKEGKDLKEFEKWLKRVVFEFKRGIGVYLWFDLKINREKTDDIIKKDTYGRKRKHCKESLPRAGHFSVRIDGKVGNTRKHFKKLEVWQSAKDGKSFIRYDAGKQRKRQNNQTIKDIQRYIEKLKISNFTHFLLSISSFYKKTLDKILKLHYNISIFSNLTYWEVYYE